MKRNSNERICLYCGHWNQFSSVISDVFNDFGKCSIDNSEKSMYNSCQNFTKYEGTDQRRLINQ